MTEECPLEMNLAPLAYLPVYGFHFCTSVVGNDSHKLGVLTTYDESAAIEPKTGLSKRHSP